jgi:hypothetical protein
VGGPHRLASGSYHASCGSGAGASRFLIGLVTGSATH